MTHTSTRRARPRRAARPHAAVPARRRSLWIAASTLILLSLLAPAAHAATPASGTLTATSGPVTYTAGPFPLANPTPVPLLDSGPECANPVQPCDDFALTVALPGDFTSTHPGELIRFTMSWTDTATGAADYDLYIYDGAVGGTDGSETARSQSASSANPEQTTLRAFDGTRTFTVKAVPYTPTGETVTVTVDLVAGPTGGGGGGGSSSFGQATPTAPGVPRYQNFYPPEGSAANAGSGEFNIGFNPATGNILTLSELDTFRVTPPERRDPPLPEAGPAEWTNVSPSLVGLTTLDPILHTDQATGRTYESMQTTGAEALFAYSDDDGASWIQASAAPPNGGADHQTLGTGPYPALVPVPNPLYPNALYYCSQDAVGPAFCQRSDDGGASFEPGVPIYDGVAVTACGGLHGHVKVGPDGAAYVPVPQCGDQQGGVVSRDAGLTWTQFLIPGSHSFAGGSTDPSIAIDAGNTVYECYVDGEGAEHHVHVAVSHDDGATWGEDADLGAAVGVAQRHVPGGGRRRRRTRRLRLLGHRRGRQPRVARLPRQLVPVHRHDLRRRPHLDHRQRHAGRPGTGRGRHLEQRRRQPQPQPARLQRGDDRRSRPGALRLRRRLRERRLHRERRRGERLRRLRAGRPPDRRQAALRPLRSDRAGGARGALPRRHALRRPGRPLLVRARQRRLRHRRLRDLPRHQLRGRDPARHRRRREDRLPGRRRRPLGARLLLPGGGGQRAGRGRAEQRGGPRGRRRLVGDRLRGAGADAPDRRRRRQPDRHGGHRRQVAPGGAAVLRRRPGEPALPAQHRSGPGAAAAGLVLVRLVPRPGRQGPRRAHGVPGDLAADAGLRVLRRLGELLGRRRRAIRRRRQPEAGRPHELLRRGPRGDRDRGAARRPRPPARRHDRRLQRGLGAGGLDAGRRARPDRRRDAGRPLLPGEPHGPGQLELRPEHAAAGVARRVAHDRSRTPDGRLRRLGLERFGRRRLDRQLPLRLRRRERRGDPVDAHRLPHLPGAGNVPGPPDGHRLPRRGRARTPPRRRSPSRPLRPSASRTTIRTWRTPAAGTRSTTPPPPPGISGC